ncbi:Uncharacterised protein [Bordetella pertussis]|nr:Uncharacterised protein [Bordetella pertussis]
MTPRPRKATLRGVVVSYVFEPMVAMPDLR